MSQRIQKRLQKKSMQKKVDRVNGAANGMSHMANPLEVPHLRVLEGNLNKLGDVVNHNANLFTHSLTVAEMRINIMQRVVNDQLSGELHTTEMERTRWTTDWGMAADGTVKEIDVAVKEMVTVVDYTWYTTYFMCCMVMVEFVSWLKKLHDKNQAANPQPALGVQDYGDAEVFGGAP